MNSAFPLSQSETFPLARTERIAIHRVLDLFEKGSPELFAELSDQIDFRIDHYRDETDVSWQVASSPADMAIVLQRLAREVFPKGTHVLGLASQALGQGWFFTRFEQRFFYPVKDCECESVTYIVSHESDGKLDFFRETVTTIVETS
ncbi:hypothetical protein [Roseibium aggregatum]|uniref:hypothetical protein n=1 Tax=Roseibium aggregatum TaxID=187304 RepID=UPI003A96A0D6